MLKYITNAGYIIKLYPRKIKSIFTVLSAGCRSDEQLERKVRTAKGNTPANSRPRS